MPDHSFDDQIREINNLLTDLTDDGLIPLTPMAYHHQGLLNRVDAALQVLTLALRHLHQHAQQDLEAIDQHEPSSGE